MTQAQKPDLNKVNQECFAYLVAAEKQLLRVKDGIAESSPSLPRIQKILDAIQEVKNGKVKGGDFGFFGPFLFQIKLNTDKMAAEIGKPKPDAQAYNVALAKTEANVAALGAQIENYYKNAGASKGGQTSQGDKSWGPRPVQEEKAQPPNPFIMTSPEKPQKAQPQAKQPSDLHYSTLAKLEMLRAKLEKAGKKDEAAKVAQAYKKLAEIGMKLGKGEFETLKNYVKDLNDYAKTLGDNYAKGFEKAFASGLVTLEKFVSLFEAKASGVLNKAKEEPEENKDAGKDTKQQRKGVASVESAPGGFALWKSVGFNQEIQDKAYDLVCNDKVKFPLEGLSDEAKMLLVAQIISMDQKYGGFSGASITQKAVQGYLNMVFAAFEPTNLIDTKNRIGREEVELLLTALPQAFRGQKYLDNFIGKIKDMELHKAAEYCYNAETKSSQWSKEAQGMGSDSRKAYAALAKTIHSRAEAFGAAAAEVSQAARKEEKTADEQAYESLKSEPTFQIANEVLQLDLTKTKEQFDADLTKTAADAGTGRVVIKDGAYNADEILKLAGDIAKPMEAPATGTEYDKAAENIKVISNSPSVSFVQLGLAVADEKGTLRLTEEGKNILKTVDPKGRKVRKVERAIKNNDLSNEYLQFLLNAKLVENLGKLGMLDEKSGLIKEAKPGSVEEIYNKEILSKFYAAVLNKDAGKMDGVYDSLMLSRAGIGNATPGVLLNEIAGKKAVELREPQFESVEKLVANDFANSKAGETTLLAQIVGFADNPQKNVEGLTLPDVIKAIGDILANDEKLPITRKNVELVLQNYVFGEQEAPSGNAPQEPAQKPGFDMGRYTIVPPGLETEQAQGERQQQPQGGEQGGAPQSTFAQTQQAFDGWFSSSLSSNAGAKQDFEKLEKADSAKAEAVKGMIRDALTAEDGSFVVPENADVKRLLKQAYESLYGKDETYKAVYGSQ